MDQISISEVQRNLHKLDDFNIVKIVDKKRNGVKGYYIKEIRLFGRRDRPKDRNDQKRYPKKAGRGSPSLCQSRQDPRRKKLLAKTCRRKLFPKRSMTLLDANIILRYLLREDEERFDEAVEIIESTECLILAEVLANVVYVLNGYYNVP